LGLVQLDEEGNVLTDPFHKQPIQMEWYYDEKMAAGLFDENAKKAAKIVEEGTVLLKNNGALPLNEDVLGGNVALIGLGSKYPVTGDQQERSFGTIRRMQSGKEALEEVTGKTFNAYPGIDYVGEPIPAEALFQDEAATKPGLVRTYGILDEDRDPVAAQGGPGGAGSAFSGFTAFDEDGVLIDTGMASYNDAGEKHPEGYPLGEVFGVDSQINFTVGTDENGDVVKTYQNGANGTAFTDQEAYTWKGYLKAPESGDYSLILECIGGMSCFFIKMEDGWKQAGRSAMREWAQWPWESLICTREGMGITAATFRLEAGKTYPILVHGRQCVKNKDLQIRIAWQTPTFAKKNYDDAIAAAKNADTIVYYACENVIAKPFFGVLSEEQPLEYTGDQMQLLRDVIAAKKPGAKLIVIAQSSNAKAIGDWEGSADAILTAYHPGQEGARVLAKIMTGQINPSGKLSQSWPAASSDTPVTDSPEHLAERGVGQEIDGMVRIRMSEGIFNGYRYYDKTGKKALYPFGHGLSYTTYEYSDLTVKEVTADSLNAGLSKDTVVPDGLSVDAIRDFGNSILVEFTVKNAGEIAGDEIVQVYLGKGDVPEYMQIAEKQLIGYQRIKNLAPGESRKVSIAIDPRMLCSWDIAQTLKERSDGTKDKWFRVPGSRDILVGASSTDIRLQTTYQF
jgi:beta-glucosidase